MKREKAHFWDPDMDHQYLAMSVCQFVSNLVRRDGLTDMSVYWSGEVFKLSKTLQNDFRECNMSRSQFYGSNNFYLEFSR